ncbi:MAG: iron-sulfur cluster assembly protein [Candidatus Aenigmatarchaeota archaeon]
MTVSKDLIIEKLKEIIDPELGCDIISMGMISKMRIKGNKAYIKIVPTSPFCPFIHFFIEMIKNKLREIGIEAEVKVDIEKFFD